MVRDFPYEITCRNRKGEGRRFLLRSCRTEDLSEILALQEYVLEILPDKNLFVRTSGEEIGESLMADFCAGAFYNEQLVMFTLMIVNRITPRSLGTSLGYDENRLRETVTYDTMFVDPAFRGYGLQELAIRLNDAEAIRSGAKEALATISPENSYSLHNAKQNGFKMIRRQPMYRGLDRYIVRKEF